MFKVSRRWLAPLAATGAVLAFGGCQTGAPSSHVDPVDTAPRHAAASSSSDAERAAARFASAYLSYSWRRPGGELLALEASATPELFNKVAANRRVAAWSEVVKRRLDVHASVEATYSEDSGGPSAPVTVVAVVRTRSSVGSTVRREVVVVRVTVVERRWLVAAIE